MTTTELRLYLPGFAIIFAAVILLWNLFKKFGTGDKLLSNETHYYNRLTRFHYVYLLALGIFFAMMLLYSFFPRAYNLFLPIAVLDHPVINITGFYILKIALIWIIIWQVKLDNRIYKYSRDINNLTAREGVFNAEKNITRGLLIMFVGATTTISNIIAILICGIALTYYFSSTRIRKHSSDG